MVQTEIQKKFSHMNDMQKQAVFCTEGPLLILAGAGSGKTTVLVNRIAYILQCELCKPWQILAITFTNKAAGELKERICAAVPEGGADIWAATFHSTCARILRRYGDRIGYTSHFTVYGTDDQKKLVKDILKQLNIAEKTLPVKSILSEISKAKDKMLTPEEMRKEAEFDSRKAQIAKVYEIYQTKLKTADAMDFDDMLCNTVKLFETAPDILDYYRNQFKYIMVDEYQDTNKVQYKFVSLLASKYGNICVVGDDDQSIYKFRGATIENILSFENTFKNAKMIRLEQNYRSTQNILNAANEVISNNTMRKGKTLWTENGQGEKIKVHTAENERDEANFIAQTILDGVADGRKYSDYAILYRMNAQSNAIEQALSRSGVPHRVIGGHRFYDREEIRDMVAYLQVINNPHDDVRLSRIINVPKRGIGATTIERVQEYADQNGITFWQALCEAENIDTIKRGAGKIEPFVTLINSLKAKQEFLSLKELVKTVLDDTRYIESLAESETAEEIEARQENIDELITKVTEYEENTDNPSLAEFLEEVALVSEIDNLDEDSSYVVLMTVHSAKGLEFPNVFLCGMEDGLFPGYMSIMSDDPEELEEERRLCYVAITRAMKHLTISYAKRRMVRGETQYNIISRFVKEIPMSLVNSKNVTDRVAAGFEKKPSFSGFGGYEGSLNHGGSGYMGSSYGGSRNFAANEHKNAYRTMAKKPAYGNPSTKPGFGKQFVVTKADIDYGVGDRVHHTKFGDGTVLGVEDGPRDYQVTVEFDTAGQKVMMASFAKLKKL